MVIHGAQKVGKSTFAAGAYKPIFIPLEDGLSGIEVDAFNGGSPLKTYEEVQQALTALRDQEHDYGTAVVDSTDWLEPMIWDYACRRNGWANIEAPGYGKGYIEANAVWREFLAGCNELRMNRGMAIVLIAHSAVKRFEAPDSEAYDRYELKMQKGALGLIVEWADAILYAADEVAIKKEDVGFNKKRARAVGTGGRVMHCNAKPSFIAGNATGFRTCWTCRGRH
ncbi:ATP-binding protein [Lysobacter enzymogenes]|uniref:ATP-binding protein n=1 Tax=Lysobacter enzymogenes TaxID=69 RepID=UPI001A9780B8|nr:ATP-binding protein [Lysobacter enzymogenes]QQP96473.1 ATP-binding protein [Lysobacter enzymogenes]